MRNEETISKHFIKIDQNNKTDKFQIRNIDFIYTINLDRRPDRWKKCLEQMAPYKISPFRVSGINGWGITQEVFNDFALKLSPSMNYDGLVHFSPALPGEPGKRIDESSYGKSCVRSGVVSGYHGCTLSHLSAIEDGYLSNYETIWVLEDDFTVKGNPHALADTIDKLNQLVGKDGWDVLYTDDDSYFTPLNVRSHFGSPRWIRPGTPISQSHVERRLIGEDFFKIGGRTDGHSYIVSRSGMKKILDYVKNQGIFLVIDTEIPCVPGINLYNLKYDLVHGRDRQYSDTYCKLKS